jgi:ribosomal protein S18 acetylase RimI-like enzyme
VTARIEVLDRDAFAAHIQRAAQIYGAAMQRSPEYVVQRREIMQAHLERRGLVAVAAVDETSGDLVGFGYGYLGRRGEWWHDVVVRALGRDTAKQWLTDAFELAELHVDPARHGRGIGRRILERLLAESGGTTVVLSTHDRDSPARALYRSVGFVELLTDFVFPGSTEVYVIMGLRR